MILQLLLDMTLVLREKKIRFKILQTNCNRQTFSSVLLIIDLSEANAKGRHAARYGMIRYT